MSAEELYSIKMRASKKENGTDVHIFGAEECIIPRVKQMR